MQPNKILNSRIRFLKEYAKEKNVSFKELFNEMFECNRIMVHLKSPYITSIQNIFNEKYRMQIIKEIYINENNGRRYGTDKLCEYYINFKKIKNKQQLIDILNILTEYGIVSERLKPFTENHIYVNEIMNDIENNLIVAYISYGNRLCFIANIEDNDTIDIYDFIEKYDKEYKKIYQMIWRRN